MAVFEYRAIDLARAAVSGTVVADTPREARDALRSRGLTIQTVHEVSQARLSLMRWVPGWTRSPRSSAGEVATLLRGLSTLLGAGVPLLEAVDTMAAQSGRSFRKRLLVLRERITSGAGLGAAMREQPEVFDEMCVAVIEVGEHGGNLADVLDELAAFMERGQQLKNRVLTALTYPLIVLAVGLGVGVFLLTVVAPNLLTALVEAGRELPWITRMAKGLSDALLAHGWWLAAAVVVVSGALSSLVATASGKRALHHLLLRLPVVGELARKQAVVRIAVVIASLTRSGVEFVKALQLARRATRNVVIAEALLRGEQAVSAGRDLDEAMRGTGVFPPLVVQVFRVGQRSGRLPEMLDRLALEYGRQVNQASDRMAALLEPALILFLAVVVGFIAFATLLPILEAGDVL